MSSCKPSCVDPRATWLEHWPAELAALSFRQQAVLLADAELHALGRANGVGASVFEAQPPAVLQGLCARLQAGLDALAGPAFVRLGSRSPKDTPLFLESAGQARTGEQALALLSAGSARVAFDLRLCRRERWQPSVYLREWHAIAPEQEWRGYLRGTQLAGLRRAWPGTDDQAEARARVLLQRLAAQVAAGFGGDVVFDAWLRDDGSATLIELNPWGPPTDTMGLDWTLLQAEAG